MKFQQSITSLRCTRRDALFAVSVSMFAPSYGAYADTAAAQAGSEEQFNYLSKNGNSNC